MNCWAFKSNYITRWNVRRLRATTWHQFIYTWFGNWALWADTSSTPYLTDEILGVQEQLHDHNLYILDLGIGHFGHIRQARHNWQINCWASKSNYMTTMLYKLDLRIRHFGQTHQVHHIQQMICWASKSNFMTTIYIYWIWEMGTLGRHAKHNIFARWNVGRPRTTT